MEQTSRIPIFPLGIVLFPTSQVPLHIFEERYKTLIDPSAQSSSVFGINYIEEDRLHSIGCTASLIEIVERYPEGELDITIEGDRRYEIIQLDQKGPTELSHASVRWIDDLPETRDGELIADTISLFNELTEIAYKGTIDQLELEEWLDDDQFPSFTIAQKSGLEAPQRQALLAMTSENERLRILNAFLKQLLPKVRTAEAINDLVRNDGYIVTWNKPHSGDS